MVSDSLNLFSLNKRMSKPLVFRLQFHIPTKEGSGERNRTAAGGRVTGVYRLGTKHTHRTEEKNIPVANIASGRTTGVKWK